MPRTYVSKSQKPYKKHDPEKIQQAVEDVKNNVLSLRKAAEKYNINYSVIHRNLKKGTLLKPQGGQTSLTANEEELLVNRLQVCSEWGYPVDTLTLRLLIKDFLDRKGKHVKIFKDNLPGREFVYSFLRRNKNHLSNRMCQNIKRSRAAVSPDIINEYFNNLEVELQGVPPQNIINYDETNLSDDPGRKKIITKRGCKYPERLMNSTKTSISLMFSITGDGKILPPYVVYKSLHLYQTWTEGGPKYARYNRTKSGWFDCFCFEDWVTTIAIPYLKKQTGKRILIGDNLASHLTVEVINKCCENDIHLVFLPANSTHLTQPLDVAFFHPMKMAWRKILEDWKQGPGKSEASLPKDKFPGLLNKLLGKITDSGAKNIQSGFKKCGIIPLDRAPVLARLPSPLEAGETEKNDQQAIDRSFVELLKTMRYGDGINPPKRKKRVKMNVVPGKSVGNASSSSSEDDISLHDTDSSCGPESEGENEGEDNAPLEEVSLECKNLNSNISMTEIPAKYPLPVSVNDIMIGDWLLVNFSLAGNNPGSSASNQKPFIGQVKSITNDGNFQAEFYRHRPSRDHQGYIYGLPNVPDVAEFHINQVIGRLNPPKEYRRGLKLFDINA